MPEQEQGRDRRDSDLEDLNRAQTASESDAFTIYRYRQFARAIPAGQLTVLDIGCNTGRGGAELKRVRPEITIHGLDMLQQRLDACPRGVYDRLMLGLLSDVDRPGGGYDVAVAGEVIEHIPWDAWDNFLTELLQVVRPGGLILMTTPNPHWVFYRLFGGSALGGAHVSAHCGQALAQYLRYRQFDVRWLRGTGTVSRLIGTRMPVALYGAYMVAAAVPAGSSL